ncbi:MAG TPA: sugar transferase [Bryobacteraceae bacterium]|jgi:lipopolysaccharide/colanic/teichoic acid biosynthesis glycosyltransferase|nr:sugar transferase [Bryobacteraceae bacterium]
MSTFPAARSLFALEERSCWRPSQTFERLVAAALFALSSPLLLAAAAITWALSGRSPFVAHRRIGLGGEPFWVFKLRTMWESGVRKPFCIVEYLPVSSVCVQKTKSDPRIRSRFAAFCRRYSVDELPQLFQVLEGRLALVGPRPITEEEMRVHYSGGGQLLSVKPGLTGLWQIHGRGELTYPQRRRLDLFLIQNFSFSLYAHILLKTPGRVLSGRGAW